MHINTSSLSPTSACLYAALASCAAFIAGRTANIYYIGSASARTGTASAAGRLIVQPSQRANTVNSMFPSPELITGKDAPKTKYTSMVSSNVLSYTAADYATLHLDTAESSLNNSEEVCIQTDDGHRKCSIDGFNEGDYEASLQQMEEAHANGSNDEEHLPSGQHLLIDIERVNSEFLKPSKSHGGCDQ